MPRRRFRPYLVFGALNVIGVIGYVVDHEWGLALVILNLPAYGAMCAVVDMFHLTGSAADTAIALGTVVLGTLFWGESFRLLGRRRSARRPQPGLCPHCRYDLTGNVSGVCPECGTPVPSSTEAPARTAPASS